MNPDGSFQLPANRSATLLFGLAAAIVALTVGLVGAARATASLSTVKGPGLCLMAGKVKGPCHFGRAVGGGPAVLSPDGRNIYVVTYTGDSLAVISRSPRTGAVRQQAGRSGCFKTNPGATGCGKARGIEEANGVAISPDGKNVYVAGEESDAIAVFKRNAHTGSLTQLAGRNGCIASGGGVAGCASGHALEGATSVAVSPDGKSLYMATDAGSLLTFDRDPVSGALTQKPGAAGCASEQAKSDCMPARALAGSMDLVVSPDGSSVYATGFENALGDIAIFARDKSSGVLTQLSGAAGCIKNVPSGGLCDEDPSAAGGMEIAQSTDGHQVYLASQGIGTVVILDRDPVTGALKPKPGRDGCISRSSDNGCLVTTGLGGSISATGIAISPDGRNVYVSNGGARSLLSFERDPATGDLRREPGRSGCVADPKIVHQCVPAPVGRVYSVEVSPDGKNVYAFGLFPGKLVALARSTR